MVPLQQKFHKGSDRELFEPNFSDGSPVTRGSHSLTFVLSAYHGLGTGQGAGDIVVQSPCSQ